MPARPARLLHSILDGFGALFGLLCGLHCALVPLLMATVPAFTLALHSFRDPWHGPAVWLLRSLAWENTLVAAAVVLCAVSLGAGWRHHRRWSPALLLAAACSLFLIGLLVPTRPGNLVHALSLVGGGVLLAAAHLNNLGLLRRHRRAERYTIPKAEHPASVVRTRVSDT